MCCLFGILDYAGGLSLAQRQRMLRVLSVACEVRGTDATGIAYMAGNQMVIQKAPRPAHRMRFRLQNDTRFILGHTRMTTQGDGTGNRNYNNHPFVGNIGSHPFALAHNGVICNDKELRAQRHLPPSKVETDSFIAVQILERAGRLDFDTLAQMAEAVRGSFTFTVLDDRGNCYFVKGNNPIYIRHYRKAGFYLYASTEAILADAVNRLGMTQAPFGEIPLKCGEILRICRDGTRVLSRFDDRALWYADGCLAYGWQSASAKPYPVKKRNRAVYDEARIVDEYAAISGVGRNIIQLLRDQGYGWLEIEEMLYDPYLMDIALWECTDNPKSSV